MNRSKSVPDRVWLTFAAACSSVSISSLAMAQTPSDQQTPPSEQTEAGRLDPANMDPDSTAETQPGKLEEITVTAQRRSEQLQRVPISITAITADTLAKAGVTDTQSLAIATPGLQLNSVRAAVVPFLRGIGTVNITAGDEGATAIYVDGVLNPVAAANVFALNNVERVEVLRGPQGTLFGRNAVGGLINVITRDPSQSFEAEGEIGYGNYDTIFGTAYITGGVAPGVAADLAFYGSHQGNGWGRNFTLDVDQNFNREFSLRSKVRAELGADTVAILSGDYSLGNSDIGSTRQPLFGTRSTGGISPVGSIYDSAGEVPPKGRKRQYGGSLKIEHDLGNAELQSTTAYREYNVKSFLDSDGTALKVFDVRETTIVDTFQQELLMNGSAGRFKYTAGLFYFRSNAGYDPIFIRSDVVRTNNIAISAEMLTQSYAGFGQATFELTPSTRVTAGLRYTYDKRKIEGTITSLPGFPTPPGPGRVLADTALLPAKVTNRHFGELTWRGVIDHDLAEDVLAYASISRGFKSGVFSLTSPTAPAVEPETLDAYEVGLKADLFDRTLRVNLAAFYYDYKNIQVTTIGATGTPILLNAAVGRFKGLDGEVVYVAPVSSGRLQFRGSFSLLDGEYTKYPGALYYNPLPAGGNVPSIQDASGNRATQAPKFTSSLSADYSFSVSDAADLGLSATWAYNDGFFWDAQNRVRENPYHLVNGQISLTSSDQAWSGRVFVKNLFDKEHFIYKSIGANGDTGAATAPRTYGIAISRKF